MLGMVFKPTQRLENKDFKLNAFFISNSFFKSASKLYNFFNN